MNHYVAIIRALVGLLNVSRKKNVEKKIHSGNFTAYILLFKCLIGAFIQTVIKS